MSRDQDSTSKSRWTSVQEVHIESDNQVNVSTNDPLTATDRQALAIQRIDAPPTPPPVEKSAPKERSTRVEVRRPDPILQSVMLLITMGCMLAAARFAVPSIVEEIRYAWHRGELRAEYETGNEG